MHYLDAGPEDGVPVVFIHGMLSSGRFYEHLIPAAPKDCYRYILPDMRGFGDTEPIPIDATRGMKDWAEDTYTLVKALGITRPVHLVGWSAGGAAIAAYAMNRPEQVASLTFIAPVSPYGFGGVRVDGTPCYPDYAGSGGGFGSDDFLQRLIKRDRSTDSTFSIRKLLNSGYWSPNHREPLEREEILVDEVLKTVTGDDGYPGDHIPSDNWPGKAPGTRGILNAISSKYCNWAAITEITPKPPILWTQGSADILVSDGSAWDIVTMAKKGLVPGWPGDEVFPPQPMVSQIRVVLERYQEAGGRVQMEMIEDSGHAPYIDAAERWSELFFGFLESVK
jgi:pimeloyl-ACP methyl ester carboxylesterase